MDLRRLRIGFLQRATATLGLVASVAAVAANAGTAFLIDPQVRQVVPGMPQARVDSLLGRHAVVGRYEWREGRTAVAIHKYNLVVDHFVPGGALGGPSSTRVVPYFVIYTLPAWKVASAGTHRAIVDGSSTPLSASWGAIFAKVVDVDTSVCAKMGMDELLQFAERNVGWKHPHWADRLTEFNVHKALALLDDSLRRRPQDADNFRRMGAFHRVRAVLGQEPGFQQAAGAYAKSLELDSSQFRSAFQLAQIRLVAGNPDSARVALSLFEHVQRRAKGELRDRARWGIAVSQWRLGWPCRGWHSIRAYLAVYPSDQGAIQLEERLRRPDNPSVAGDTLCPGR